MISERLYEIALVVLVAVIILAFGIAELREFSREAREIALKADLQKMRSAIMHHYARNNRYPKSLQQAVSEGFGRKMTLLLYDVDDEGHARDPFGRRYFYNPATGEVRSRTPGHEKD